eukprot:7887894-Alexandrium_andersonii.AAC.1
MWREGLHGDASFTAVCRARVAALTASSKARPAGSMVASAGGGRSGGPAVGLAVRSACMSAR